MKAVIMAGGKGTRIASVNSEVPKPMIKICGRPILEHQIKTLKKQGINDFVLVVGYKKDMIKDYFKDGSSFGVKIWYIEENEPLGTAGSLYYFRDSTEDILLINGDIIFDMDINRFIAFHKEKDSKATIVVHPNDHPYDSSLIVIEEQRDEKGKKVDTGKVVSWIGKEHKDGYYRNLVNAGIHIISKSALREIRELKKTNLDKEILKPLIEEGGLYAYATPEYIKDMGTPERLKEVEKDIKNGKVLAKSLANKQKAVFLDRDGTINIYRGFMRDIKNFELNDGAAKAIKLINESGYLVIVVTNQPVIARGEVTWDELDYMHNKMETIIGKSGAYIDDIYICPHHPDSGFDGEIKSLKFECDCRKPKPGLLLEAAGKYNIDLKQSVIIGDRETDLLAGRAVGCKGILVDDNYTLFKAVKDYFHVK